MTKMNAVSFGTDTQAPQKTQNKKKNNVIFPVATTVVGGASGAVFAPGKYQTMTDLILEKQDKFDSSIGKVNPGEDAGKTAAKQTVVDAKKNFEAELDSLTKKGEALFKTDAEKTDGIELGKATHEVLGNSDAERLYEDNKNVLKNFDETMASVERQAAKLEKGEEADEVFVNKKTLQLVNKDDAMDGDAIKDGFRKLKIAKDGDEVVTDILGTTNNVKDARTVTNQTIERAGHENKIIEKLAGGKVKADAKTTLGSFIEAGTDNLKKVSSEADKAFDTIKGDLPKTHFKSASKWALGGLVVGLIGKLLFGGKKEQAPTKA